MKSVVNFPRTVSWRCKKCHKVNKLFLEDPDLKRIKLTGDTVGTICVNCHTVNHLYFTKVEE